MTDLTGRAVVVTGGNSGLGLGLARGVGRAGARVIIWSRTTARNEQVANDLREEGIDAYAVTCDTSDEESVDDAMQRTLDQVGAVDTMFANAGIAASGRFVETTLDDWHKVLRTNLDGTFLTTRAAARHFIDRGTGGAIVVVSSTIARYGGAGQVAYATSKTGLLGLARTLSVELARHQVRVNTLIPGWTATAMNDHLRVDEKFHAATIARTPARRWADPDEFHKVAVFLADPSQTFHTGNDVIVDGGYTIF